MTSNVPPNCGYSLKSVLKQWGHDRDDLLHAVALEHLDVLLGEHLVDVLGPHAPGGIAGAVLLAAEHGEVHAGDLHQLARSRRRPSCCGRRTRRHNRPRKAPPHRGCRRCAGSREAPAWTCPCIQSIACLRRLAPGVAGRLEVLQRALHLAWEARLAHDEIASHVDDDVDVLDVDGAGLHAGSTGRAVPDDLVLDDVADSEAGSAATAACEFLLARPLRVEQTRPGSKS